MSDYTCTHEIFIIDEMVVPNPNCYYIYITEIRREGIEAIARSEYHTGESLTLGAKLSTHAEHASFQTCYRIYYFLGLALNM